MLDRLSLGPARRRSDGVPDTRPAAPDVLGRHDPVVVAWTTPGEVTAPAGHVAGTAGSASVRTSELAAQYVTGGVALDAPDLAAIHQRPDGAGEVRAIVMHELGHLVGLDHVDDPGELMHRQNVGQLAFGPGDREGLAALGSGSCMP